MSSTVEFFALTATHAQQTMGTLAQLSAASKSITHPAQSTDNPPVLLATCNRFEIYSVAPSALECQLQAKETVDKLAQALTMPAQQLCPLLEFQTGRSVYEHLFTVAAGLDSAVVGEREIAGQVRQALARAQDNCRTQGQRVPTHLVRLFQAASRVAKRVGAETALNRQGRSLISVALDTAETTIPHWEGQRVLLIGTGAYARLAVKLLQERQVSDIVVYSSSGRAHQFASRRSLRASEDLTTDLREADVIVSCSGALPHVSAQAFAQARGQRLGTPVTVIDLTLSGDFDPAIRALPGVRLLNLETLATGGDDEAIRQAQALVAEAVESFSQELSTGPVEAAIVALRGQTMEILAAEMERVRLQYGCTGATEDIELALRRLVRRLLHTPTSRGHDLAAAGRSEEYIRALQTLYGIESPNQASTPMKPVRNAQEHTDGCLLGRACSRPCGKDAVNRPAALRALNTA